MTGELNLGENKITKLANPILAEDATNKYYVDEADAQIDARLTTLRTDYDAHVNQFTRINRNNQRTIKAVENFLSPQLVVDVKLADINKSLSDINTRLGVIREDMSFSDLIAGLQKITTDTKKILDDVVAGIPQIATKINLIKIPDVVTPENIVNVSYVVSAGSATCSQQNKTIKYTASATGIYRLSVLSTAEFKILNISGVMTLVILLCL